MMERFAPGSIYELIRGELAALAAGAYPEHTFLFDADSGHAEFSSPMGYRLGCDAGLCAAQLRERMQKSPPKLLGRDLLSDITHSGGHVLFRLGAGAYSAAVRHINGKYPLPPLPDDTREDTRYAVARMLMLARMGGEGCPDDPAVMRAVWLALGTEGFCGAKREALRRRAALALLTMLTHRTLQDRERLRRRMGEAAAACARLLCIGE